MDNRVIGKTMREVRGDRKVLSITRDAVQSFFNRLRQMATLGVHPNRRPEGQGRCLVAFNSSIKKRMRNYRRGNKPERKTYVQQNLAARGLKA